MKTAAAGSVRRGAATLHPDGGGAYWRGSWQPVRDELEVLDPGTARRVGAVAESSAEDADAAIRHLRDHRREPWPLWARREAIARAARMLADQAEDVARLLSLESSKTIREARNEVARAGETLRLSAEASHALEGRTVPFEDTSRGAGWIGWYSREPIGIVAAITPFNDPLNLVAHKLGPALLAGNAVILKPSSSTPLSAFALTEILLRAGVPGTRLAVLCGSEASRAIVSSTDVDVISFTGGPESADAIVRSGRARKLLMELGGNNALVACRDADADAVVGAVVDGAFSVAGQNCLSVQRVLVASEIHAEIVRGVVAGARALVVGDKSDEATEVGPMITVDEAIRVEEWIAQARAAGATVHSGGERSGAFLTPAVLTGVPRSARLWREEVFGPVVVLEPFDTLDDAVEAANDSETALQAGVFTRDIETALELAERIEAGAVMINSSSDFRVDAMPFGGFKRSGIGREGVVSAVEAFSEPKIVAVRRAGAD